MRRNERVVLFSKILDTTVSYRVAVLVEASL